MYMWYQTNSPIHKKKEIWGSIEYTHCYKSGNFEKKIKSGNILLLNEKGKNIG